MPTVDPKGTTRFADDTTIAYIKQLEDENAAYKAALKRIAEQSWGTPEQWYKEWAALALQP